MKDDEEKKVRYVCDMRACEDCSYPECEYTTDVAHAMHFYNDGGGYVEVAGTFDMTPNEYQRLALFYEFGMDKSYPRIFNAMLGLTGEAGECADLVKKCAFQGHELDKEHLAKELGDVLWYVSLAADAVGMKLGDVMALNLKKLKARYPEGFDAEKSRHRAEVDV